jgi:hypothetical protein
MGTSHRCMNANRISNRIFESVERKDRKYSEIELPVLREEKRSITNITMKTNFTNLLNRQTCHLTLAVERIRFVRCRRVSFENDACRQR